MKIEIKKAEAKDLEEIYKLQKTAYITEAQIHNNYNIQPLTQTLEEIRKEFENGIILKASTEAGKIIGSVRGFAKDKTLYIGKLMVQQEFRDRGTGKRLLKEIESYFPDMHYELFTSAKSGKNLSLYIKSGYKEFKREYTLDGIELVYLEKYTSG